MRTIKWSTDFKKDYRRTKATPRHAQDIDGLLEPVAALLAEQARRSGVRSPLEPGLQERFFQRPDTHPSPGRARWSCLEEA